MNNIICLISSVIVSSITYLVGGFDTSFIVLLIVMGLDYVTGVCKAIYKKNLNSFIGIKGIIKKFGIILIVVLSVLLDKLTGNTNAIKLLVIYFFVANESISILENWGSMGLPLPKKLYSILENLKEEGSDTDGVETKINKT